MARSDHGRRAERSAAGAPWTLGQGHAGGLPCDTAIVKRAAGGLGPTPGANGGRGAGWRAAACGGVMLSKEENQLLTRTGPSTPMGELLRRFWLPALLSEELPQADGVSRRLSLPGEDLVAFRDSQGEIGIRDAYCAHRRSRLSSAATKIRGCAASTTAGSTTLLSTVHMATTPASPADSCLTSSAPD